MKVAIIGAGAVGLLTAAYLCKANVETVIYTRRDEQASVLNQNGIELHKKGKKSTYFIQSKPLQQGLAEEDLLIITVKQYDIEGIFHYLTSLNSKTPILFLQNGMTHLSYLPSLMSTSIFLGIVEHGVVKLSDYRIEHRGIGQIKLASYKGDLSGFDNVWASLNSVGFPIKKEEQWYPILAKKLIANAVINPLTAIYKVRNGKLLEDPNFQRNMKQLFDEIISILHIADEKDSWEEVVKICSSTSANYSSMYMDIACKRQTEVDSILGYLLEVAENNHKSLPLVTFLYHSIKGMENSREVPDHG
ncbi:2-dehydropantoate 2-reductase [Calidifontibacillus oryziterrae]|uniref:2-dehydropantoate 2-reductase n=1 Tax=Calidifontibacillus oryziterrae TaxID=1191699 RepID=UPI0002F21F44|nr:2-dehydropantoate 2-reductase [Calidifontibacillus oryziterrae]